ncbi:Protein farnesyltransferase/geranylgeranyltransferase type-1 subunit alpha [Cladobotryum mycophilum]|uniref:Protein farnesyltransferase/geranylgeranyltransferase type-1 subunit alpha n=1 Tax=Cladobotryum mycophilum TaxID=491253 RepID=A0ABR0SP89_9HYPO
MPAKPKASAKASIPEPKAAPEPVPETVGERSRQRYSQTNPFQTKFEDVGFPGLTPAEKKTYTHTKLILPVAKHTVQLSNKTEREFWKHVTKEALPIRRLGREYGWGRDRHGREVGTYGFEEFNKRTLDKARLTALDILHRQFLAKREAAAQHQGAQVSQEDIEAEKKRRRDMAELKRQLYGEIPGALANDPEWDDVVPIPQDEPEDALAKIAYPDDYAEAISYLRAVMAADEISPRALRLTETVIAMNPAHYTVWLYRFKIVTTLSLPIPAEIAWLNAVALENLKNYQIWHHRQLILDHYYPTLTSSSSPDADADADAAKKFAKAEMDFIVQILEEDTKNYHVWSYRQYLTTKLSLFTATELCSTQNMIEDDLRNNSAWSHRFFVVFSDPSHATHGSLPTQHDPKVPDAIIDREANYAKEKILLAPQNQSAWHYLRGVLTKGGRALDTVGEFASQFFSDLGEEGEQVRSSHALDLMSEVYAAQGDVEKAKLCLQRLWEKWDPVREGYWKYRAASLKSDS